MDDVKNMVKQLIAHESEEDWFEFKDSWYDANGIGESVPALPFRYLFAAPYQ